MGKKAPRPEGGTTPRTLSELETIVRWDAEEKRLHWWTANIREAKRWRSKGYAVEQRGSGWLMDTPLDAVTLRRAATLGRKKTHAPRWTPKYRI
jgi:hypothetical protein